MTTTTETLAKEAEAEIQTLADKDADSTDSNIRYMAYGSRLRTALVASSRYVAYTSDVGEAFRPVVHPRIVTAAYGISWLYLTGDVGYEAYKAYRRGPSALDRADGFSERTRIGMVAVQRAVFQSIASMALPALTIHTVVAQSGRLWKNAKNPRARAWGPTLTGLGVVPALPYLFDHPVEQATEKAFDWIKEQLAKSNGKGHKEL
ncbi:SubName: Full=Uncharacterized protein {ECO:0000313/EMBL:CCA75211.1} [Serendipita indica DSM 11827]|uniref:Mitochondrial fission process protein 1 n=1 Tax=Serendipita indica (strain DSM 11827) TaxID=1109443 RepID=G4TV68_SERID|nr:SubName: Full=Uncharacterized protein {ECO:0000313/EMBL:CCA75211.1} [Serendipita indica DSM 11827]CCA75211.1 hypothetical protein PIIN_09195 [Serendipita indica DSM 11827]